MILIQFKQLVQMFFLLTSSCRCQVGAMWSLQEWPGCCFISQNISVFRPISTSGILVLRISEFCCSIRVDAISEGQKGG